MIWPDSEGRRPLWSVAEVAPLTPEFEAIGEGESLTFLPLEAVWPSGRADLTRRIKWDGGGGSYTRFRRGDLLLPKVAPTFSHGRAMVADIDTAVGLATSEVFPIRPRKGVDSRWLTYCLRSQEFLDEGTHSLVGVGGLKRISAQQVSEYGLPDADQDMQRRTANYLDHETAAMDTMSKQLGDLIATLIERRGALIRGLVPSGVTAAIESSAGGGNLSGSAEGWHSKPLRHLFRRRKIVGFTEEPMLSVFRDLGVVLKDDHANLNRTAEDRSIYQLVEPGWLVVNRMKAWQGSVGISERRGIVSGHYICFEPQHSEDHAFLNLIFRSSFYRDWFEMYSRGVRPAQQEIDNGWLEQMPVWLPALGEQRRIVARFKEESVKIDVMIAEAKQLKELIAERRSALITEVVTGRKEV